MVIIVFINLCFAPTANDISSSTIYKLKKKRVVRKRVNLYFVLIVR